MIKKLAAVLLAGTSIAAVAAAGPAAAQQSPAPEETEDEQEIVVTGSQIRGIAPTGVAVIGLSEEEVLASGATTGAELLAQLPQVSNYFNSIPGVAGNSAQFVNRSAVSRPNLRSLPNSSTANAPFTLALVDGHRMVPVGISNASGFDPDTVAPALVQRVEVLPDGASAIYGSDAVTGVINYITRSSFDGVQVSAHYGASNVGYETSDLGVAAGFDWGSGNAFGSVNASRHDALYGRDLDYIRNVNFNPTSPTFGLAGLGCAPGNVTIGAAVYPINATGVIQPTSALAGNRCDIADSLSIVPSQETVGFMGGIDQEITDSLRFDVRAWVQRRENVSNNGAFASPSPNVGNFTITAASPNYQVAPGTVGNPTQSIGLDLSSLVGPAGRVRNTDVDFWQITPRVTWDIGGGWQLRALYSRGETEANGVSLDTNIAGVNAAILSGAFNPYTLTGTTTGFVATTLRNGKFAMDDYMAVADGPLFNLPGGPLRAAIGVERNELDFDLIQPGLVGHDEQTVDSVFAELQIPILSADNSVPFVHALSLSLSGRQDSYASDSRATINNTINKAFTSSFDTSNHSIGLNWEPVEWATIRGNIGTSFTSPNAQDRVVVPALTITNPIPSDVIPLLPVSAAAWPFGPTVEGTASMGPNAANAIALVLTSGSATNLKPQTSENWSTGFEVRPMEGMTFGASFYSIHITDMLASAATATGLTGIVQNFPQLITTNGGAPLTAAQIQAFTAQTTGLNTTGAGEYATTFLACAEAVVPTCPVAYIGDNRTQNLLELYVEGIDLNARYEHEADWGGWDISFAGNNAVTFHQIVGPAATDRLDIDNPEWKWALTGGLTLGQLRAQATLQYTSDFNVAPGSATAAPFGQSEVDSFSQVDLYFRYDLDDLAFTDRTSLSLNINNLFDKEPPPYASTVGSYPGIFQGDSTFVLTTGRFIQVGLVSNF